MGVCMERAILLVEDNDDDIDLTLRALNKCHLSNDVVVARDGQEALNYLRAARTDPSWLPVLVLLDLRLPKVDGLDVLRRIRSAEATRNRSEEHTSELQSHLNLVCRLLLEKKNYKATKANT